MMNSLLPQQAQIHFAVAVWVSMLTALGVRAKTIQTSASHTI